MPLIKVSLKGLAKFMTASPASQRKIVRDFKYPDPEGVAQAAYYRDARDRIAAYHQNNHPADWLSSRADALTTRAASSTGRSATRLRNNARALRQYEAGWGDNRLEVLDDLKLELTYGGVRVSVVPDLHVNERGIEKIIKFEFGTDEPDIRVANIMAQGLFQAANAADLGLMGRDVKYVDVPRGKVHNSARVRSRLTRDLEAACRNFEAIWGSL